ncbi:VF530 family DNA-binding protein [Budvicia diplopodorum]|uniref:VF530 family protein n=1 Tax=Budvicia diplopodorum TaxID=1119056 RepID=UPI001356B512|nr:VF530 family protein [Budvicia diplopodorum]
MDQQTNDPLHGVTLERLLTILVDKHGWEKLAGEVNINCFKSDPSVKSSLKFLRRTPWARKQVEELYIRDLQDALEKPKKSDKPQRLEKSEKSDDANGPWGKWAK